ncbi:FecR domain-containing protein [Bermanella marisrubri]|uniref:FecR protein domain-containing protein n=1 Tax=Bermanella marisrubri TaxID=207949 RepID=Q1N3Q5_9GAMM|nr:FecR family protein [Bermanella marisrubri]EAT12819.1 hypothetical protein RED65_12139 [Oceanobacter sp. RED65] [Bermanella marisrubri]QIZ83142.1 FecR domain-containing protein [Bermanella marisrubri]
MKVFIFIFFSLFLSIPSFSADIAARVIIAKGTVIAQNDTESRALKRRSEIYRGEIIRTGPNSSVQLRFIDKALMTIKANSELDIEEYVLKSETTASDKALLKLVKGGFRTITGSIGKGDKDAYKVSTPAASIGIRGTAYEVQQEANDSFVVGVYEGGIRVENESGSIDLGLGADYNYSRVTPNTAPKGLLAPPTAFGLNSATNKPVEGDEEENSNETEQSSDESDTELAENQEQDGQEEDADFTDSLLSDNDNEFLADIDQVIVDAVDTKLAETIEASTSSEFDFNNPYAGVNISNSSNPFAENIISDEAYALGESGKLGLVAIPSMFNFFGSGETPTIPLMEAQLESFNTMTDASIETVTYAQGSTVEIRYSILEKSGTNGDYVTRHFQYEIPIAESSNTTVTNSDDLNNIFQFTSGILYEETNNGRIVSSDPIHINIYNAATTGEFRLQIATATSDPTQAFLSSLELDIFGVNEETEQKFYQQIGSQQLADGSYSDQDWYTQAELEVFIGNGSWDPKNNQPILVENEEEQDGTTRIAIIKKDNEDNQVIDSYLAYTSASPSCGGAESSLEPCDIQVKDVGGRDNIRWGVWISEPDEPITITDIDNGSAFTEEESNILAFWIAAERADINQLSGTASFTANDLDCTDLTQCMGFADDGVVTSLSGNFSVDFNNSRISQGSINLDVSDSVNGSIVSQWDVSFQNAQIKGADFHTNQIQGSVKDSAGTEISSHIVGNIGGIFVKPGDKAVGGYNFGALDTEGIHKHATGVFQLDKQ